MRLLLLFILLIPPGALCAQTDTANTTADTVPRYKKTLEMPEFAIKMPNQKWLTKYNLKPNTATLLLYFSPDCGHCQKETEEILSNISYLRNLQIVMVTSRPFEDMTAFAQHYKIGRFPSIKIGIDPARLVTQFYAIKFTPFSALYDRKGKMVKVYEKDIDIDELIELVK